MIYSEQSDPIFEGARYQILTLDYFDQMIGETPLSCFGQYRLWQIENTGLYVIFPNVPLGGHELVRGLLDGHSDSIGMIASAPRYECTLVDTDPNAFESRMLSGLLTS